MNIGQCCAAGGQQQSKCVDAKHNPAIICCNSIPELTLAILSKKKNFKRVV
jgi:hypothetical protein